MFGDHRWNRSSLDRFSMRRTAEGIFVFISFFVRGTRALTVFVVVAKMPLGAVFTVRVVVLRETGYPGAGTCSSRCHRTGSSWRWYG
jgi:hypothetical protein